MSVSACVRNGCDSIMCDLLSHSYGYICYQCRSELIDKGVCDIQEFLDSPKLTEVQFNDEWESFIEEEFKMVDYE